MSSSAAALSYHEPEIVTILILSSFLILENAVNYVFDHLLFCGLLGQIAIGVAWGTPGAKWLSQDVETAVMQLGYLGLILIVFEGGLSTNLKTLKSNLVLSSVVALIGIGAPIGLSFTLQGFMEITQVQAFAAGAALCSTSLGTTFTILSTSGLSASRVGVVLSSAAMMDDIVGLVMSGIISSLGQSSDFSAITVIRPVFVSIAFAVFLPLFCLWPVKPLTKAAYKFVAARKQGKLASLLHTEGASVAFQTLLLIALVTSASYAGTSNLFAAYLAGALVTWWDDLLNDIENDDDRARQQQNDNESTSEQQDTVDTPKKAKQKATNAQTSSNGEALTASPNERPVPNESRQRRASTSAAHSAANTRRLRGSQIFEKYYQPALHTVLKPFFFASIGFSIPITQMFSGTIVWKGIVYTMLMTAGKLLCGLFLLPFGNPVALFERVKKQLPAVTSACWPVSIQKKAPPTRQTQQASQNESSAADRTEVREQPRPSKVKQPVSLYPAALLGGAMVARGEIGFLISSVAESNGVFGTTDNGQNSELFLVVTWAILLCTLLGPIAVGLMVRRVKRLQSLERGRQSGRQDPLGSWGIISST